MPKPEGLKQEWKPAPEPVKKNPFKLVESKDKTKLVLDMAGSSEGKEGRVNNEDSFMFDAGRGLLCVADGMGGTTQGGQASRIVIEGLAAAAIKAFKDKRADDVFNAPADKPLANYDRIAVENAIKEYLLVSLGRRVQKEAPQGDTTASLAKIWTDERGQRNLTIANIGDSRIYRLRKGRLERLTQDQSLLEGLISRGLIDEGGSPITSDHDVTRRLNLKDIEARSKKDKYYSLLQSFVESERKRFQKKGKTLDSLTLEDIRHIVMNGVNGGSQAQVKTFDVEQGDLIVAVSDGISDNLDDNKIADSLSKASDADQASKLLRIHASLVSQDGANPRSKPDDMTAAAMLIA